MGTMNRLRGLTTVALSACAVLGACTGDGGPDSLQILDDIVQADERTICPLVDPADVDAAIAGRIDDEFIEPARPIEIAGNTSFTGSQTTGCRFEIGPEGDQRRVLSINANSIPIEEIARRRNHATPDGLGGKITERGRLIVGDYAGEIITDQVHFFVLIGATDEAFDNPIDDPGPIFDDLLAAVDRKQPGLIADPG